MLCFEISKNGQKVTRAGLRERGVVSLILSWVGKGAGASELAASQGSNPIPGLHWHVGGIDSSDPAGDRNVDWLQDGGLKLNDEIRVRLISGTADAPVRRDNSVPASSGKAGERVTQCPFCSEMRKTEPKGWLAAGIGGANVFICTRCLILAERLLHSEVERLFHLTRTTDQTCSFCLTERAPNTATGQTAHMCTSCVDMMMS